MKRDWFAGLNPDPNDHSHPDVGADADDSGIGERANKRDIRSGNGGGGGGNGNVGNTRRKLLEVDSTGTTRDMRDSANNNKQQHGTAATVQQGEEVTKEAADSFSELFADYTDDDDGAAVAAADKKKHTGGGGGHEDYEENDDEEWLDDDNVYSMDDYEYKDINADGGGGDDGDEYDDNEGHDVRTIGKGHQGHQERPHGHHHDPPKHHQKDGDDENENEENDLNSEDDYWDDFHHPKIHHDYHHNSKLWEDEVHRAPGDLDQEFESPFVWIDAHVLASPAIADIDGDGRDEIVVPVSYFFDPGEYAVDSVRSASVVGKDGDPGKYVASGVVVFDLHTRGVKWSTHLDLSTRYTRYKAEVHSTPTLADLDRDGRLEVIVGTSMGWVYVLDPKTGAVMDNWPVQLGDVQGQVAVGDVDGDGWLEMVVCDTRGSVAALRLSGKEVWERHLGSAMAAGATLGDVDGDGALEVILGTFDGRIHVLDARTGVDKPSFPFRTFGRIVAPILATKLSDPRTPGLQLVATSHDGFLYVIDGVSGCADSIDLGEPSYAMVLADDLANSGTMDLLAATAGGNIYAFRTPSKYQPLKAWPAQVPGQGAAGFSARWNWEGVYTTATSRVPRDVRGEAVPVRFTIVDNRPPLPGGKSHGPYKISVTLQGIGAKQMNTGKQPIIGMSDVVNKTGTYTLEVPCPRSRTSATIRVEMKDETGAVFVDEFALSFHIHFYRLLKWMAVGPFAFTAAAVFLMGGGAAAAALRAELPS